MKKKLFLIVIAVLVVALMCGVLLVACDDNNDPPTPPPPAGDGYPYTENVGTVLEMIIDNLDAEAKADNGEIAVAMELKSEGKVLFGLAFEELGGEQIMYAALNSNVYAKFNGFNLGEVVESALGLITNPDGSLNIPGVDLSKVLNGALANIKLNAESVKSLIELIVTFGILAENGVVHDANEEVLTVSLDLASIVGLVGGFVKADTIAGAVGIYKQDQDGNYLDKNGKPTTKPEEYVGDGAVIDGYINQYAPIILTDLPKDGEGKYTGGLSGIFTYIAGLAAQAQFDITFATGDIVRDDTQNPFIGTSVGTAREKDAVNLLTFNVDGSFNAYTKATSTSKVVGEGEDAKTETDIKLEGDKSVYDIQIDGSLDPFVAIELLNHYIASVKAGNGDKTVQDAYWDDNFPAVMKSMLSKVGYLQITVDEYAIKGESREFTNNILTLSFNSDQGYILANANIHAAADNELDKYDDDGWISLGGTYDMDTFVDYLICVMEGGKIGAGAAADGEGSIIDTIIGYIPTIIELVKKNAVITGTPLEGEVIADGVALNLGVLVDGAFDMILGGLETTDKDWLNTWDGFVKALVSASIGTDGNIDFGMLNGIQGIEIKFADWSAAFGNAEFRDLTKLDAYKGIVSDIVAGDGAKVTKSGDVYKISGSFAVTTLGGGTPVTVQAEDLVLIAAEEVFDADGNLDKVIAFVASPSEITEALANWEGQTQKVVYPFSGMHAIEFEF
mgnify:CR=1 FL=1